MNIQKNTVVALVAGVVVGTLMGASTIQFATFTAQGVPPSYAKTIQGLRNFGSDDSLFFFNFPKLRQVQGLKNYRGSAPVASECDKFSGQRETRCKAAEKEGIEYQPQDYRAR